MGRLVWVWVLVCAGCFHSDELVCDDGRICPAGSTCDVPNDRCLTPAAVAACNNSGEGSDCLLGEQPGECRAGACDPFVCGNGSAERDEQCDGSDLKGLDCEVFGYYGSAGLTCDECTLNRHGCEFHGFCGDAVVNGPELCDGGTDKTCVELGFDAGAVACTLSCGLTLESCSHFGWNAEPLGAMIANAVAGTSATDQWAVGASGAVQQFDGFWRDASPGVPNDLLAVSMAGAGDLWVVGASSIAPLAPSVVLHHDPLTGWATLSDAPAGNYVDIWAASPTSVFAAADTGIHAWHGDTWSTLPALPTTTPPSTPIAIRGTSPDDLWVATSAGPLQPGPLVHWDGTSWTPAPIPDAALHFIDANAPDDVWTVGSSVDLQTGVIAHWDGVAWTEWRASQETYGEIASSGPNDAWVAVADDTMLHFDGTGWLHTTTIGASPSGLAAISGLASIDGAEVVAVSTLNLAYRFRGQSFGGFPVLPDFAIPNPRLQTAIWGDSSANQFVTNVLGEIVHWDGAAWTTVFTIAPLIPGDSLSATWVWGAGGGDVWVSTSDGRVLHATDGLKFADTGLAATTGIDVIWGTGPTNVWAFGQDGAFQFDGAQWTPFGVPTARALSVSGSGPSDIWEVTDEPGGTLRHFDGMVWSVVPGLPMGEPLRAVIAVDADTTFVAAGHGHILRRHADDSWTVDVVPAKAELQFFAASGPHDVTVASDEELFHHDGLQWSPLRAPVDFVPNTMNFVPIAGLQASPGRLDMLLQSSRVRSLLLTRPIACELSEVGHCSDGVDNDCDGVIDNCN